MSSSLLHNLRRLREPSRGFWPYFAAGLTSALVAGLLGLAIPQVLRWLVNGPLAADAAGASLWWGVALVLGLGIGEAALITARRRLLITPGGLFERNLRVQLYRHLMTLPPSTEQRWSPGQLLSRSMGDIRRFKFWLTFGAVMIVVNISTIAVGIVVMLAADWMLGLIFVAAAVPAFAISLRARRDYHLLARRSMQQSGDIANTVEESVHGIRVLKAFGRSSEALAAFTDQAAEFRGTELAKARSRAIVTLVMTLLPQIALGVILIIGLLQLARGTLSVGALLAFFATAALLAGPLERLSEQFAMTQDAASASDRYLEVLDAPDPLPDPAHPTPVPSGPGQVEFAHVSYHFPDEPTGHGVLTDVDLSIRGGETLALIGATGSGKTTLAQLIPRFADVTAGSIRIDGVDVRALTRHDLRGLISIAFEDPVLFSATVAENVRLGAPEASDAEVRKALKVASADFVDDLPDGLDTRIGEEGLSLSGGQRQRLSLARAIIARPRVLVLDDPLSALDVRTEAAVTQRLTEFLQQTTTLVIAHRPSTVALADRVALLDDGRITHVGAHRELLRASDRYRELVTGLAEPAGGRR